MLICKTQIQNFMLLKTQIPFCPLDIEKYSKNVITASEKYESCPHTISIREGKRKREERKGNGHYNSPVDS